eukprot:GFUD01028858.1.p1 GENE.GFUD01028858.1~~GFUD01028858.1.p1  ORF type:complete len:447 (+),score=141.63 GFUD01028858.1:49-1389(+)
MTSPTDSARVMSVKLGHLVDPRTVWAYPLYEQGGQHARILVLERQLAELPGGGERLTEHTATGSLLAVRRSQASQIWHRGKLDQLSMYGKQLMATVFLIDYGEVLETVTVDTCARHLPAPMWQEPPIAFQILLAGLEPVSMDLDFMLGQNVMEATPARKWDQAALVEVRKEMKVVKGVAELRSWVVDQMSRYQGELYLVEETGRRIHLNQMLIEKQFAVFSQWQVENDMAMTGEWDNNKECRAVDYRDAEIASWELSEEEVSGKSLEEFTSEAFGESEIKETSIDSGASACYKLGHMKSAGRGRDQLFRRKEASDGEKIPGTVERMSDHVPGVNVSGGTMRDNRMVKDVREQYQSQLTRVDKAKEFLDMLKKRNAGDKADEDIWAGLRDQQSQGGKRPDSSSTHLLPGGVFIGKYHENVLAHIQANSKGDQKKKFEQFVAPRKGGN